MPVIHYTLENAQPILDESRPAESVERQINRREIRLARAQSFKRKPAACVECWLKLMGRDCRVHGGQIQIAQPKSAELS